MTGIVRDFRRADVILIPMPYFCLAVYLVMKASDLFVKCLEAEGVEYIFGVPGEENLDFLDSMSRSSIKLDPA